MELVDRTGSTRLLAMAPLQRDVTASGVRLRVAESGVGPTVVLIHGLFVDHTSWDRVTELMTGRFRVIAPDLPGFGESEKPPPNRFPYGVDAFAEAIADLYAGLELGRAAVVGHGLGGAVALTLTARHPELVSRLILVDPLCYSAYPRLLRRVASTPFVGGFVFKQLWGRALFRSHFRKTMLSEGATVDPQRIDAYYQTFNSPAARGSALATLRNTVDTRPIVAQTSRIQTPSLVLWGRSDRLYPVSFGQRLSREIRGARFELIDTGHAPQEERPEELAAHISRFLEAKLSR
jgi:pimeloyl-ACP methyl ester carboxylesterase